MRIYIYESLGRKEIIQGVSPRFAMTQMDDEPHPECELYVEDDAAKIMLGEILGMLRSAWCSKRFERQVRESLDANQ